MIEYNRLRFRFALITISCLLIGTLGAQTVIYSNLAASSSNPVQNWAGTFKLGQSFTASASGAISSISLNLTMSSTSVPVYSVELWSDNGGSTHLPSALLATFVSGQNWSAVYSGSPGVYNASNTITFPSAGFTQNYSVASGTSYWLVVSSTSGSAKAWGVSSTLDGPTASYSSTTSTWGSISPAGALGAAVSVSAIPEPGTYAAFAGLVALSVAVYRRRRSPALQEFHFYSDSSRPSPIHHDLRCSKFSVGHASDITHPGLSARIRRQSGPDTESCDWFGTGCDFRGIGADFVSQY
jgi:hypothetical protein